MTDEELAQRVREMAHSFLLEGGHISTEDVVTNEEALNLLDESTQKLVKNEAEVMVHIRTLVENKVKDLTVDPHPGMIWEMTHAIWLKYFGAPEK